MISYAQNFEDVMLWRALKNVKNGFYVDVGAGGPVDDSVTKWFYDQGWSGINIEPNDEDFEALSKERNRDTNLKLAVGPHQGLAQFFLNKTKGWSTMNAKTAKAAKALGSPSEIIEVESMPLRKILENENPSVIHFMKIDVEGYEEQVLESADFEKYRPWIILVEFADLKGNYGDPVMAFPILKKKDYKPVLFDGLNVYYVAQERSELSAFFKTPASVFDEYTLYKYSRDMESLRVQFVSSEKDRKARLKVIEEQGKRVGELEEEVHRRLKEIKGLYEERDKLGQQSQALAQELESLRSQFVSSEKDREARGRVIEEQGKQVGELEEKTLHQKEELIRISQKLIQISDESVSILAKIKIILIVANPLIAFVGRQLLKDLEAKLVEGKKVMKFS